MRRNKWILNNAKKIPNGSKVLDASATKNPLSSKKSMNIRLIMYISLECYPVIYKEEF